MKTDLKAVSLKTLKHTHIYKFIQTHTHKHTHTHTHTRTHVYTHTQKIHTHRHRGVTIGGAAGAAAPGPVAGPKDLHARRAPHFQVHRQASLDGPNLSIASNFLGYAYVQIRAVHNKAGL